ncbi:MAG: serine/threonine-protein kinase [Acidiferrobacterales bacterium]
MASDKTQELSRTVVIGDCPPQGSERTFAVVPTAEVLASGTHLDQYVIEGELGGGGMGMVYKGHDTLLDRPVALKVLPPHLCTDSDFARRFAREARVQARIDSPHVATLHAVMERPEGLVLVMDYLEGESLETRLRNRGPLSAKEAVAIFEQAALGTEHIHRLGIVHQDLKPGNIYVASNGVVKLLDFGVAKVLRDQGLNQGGEMIGTLLYMSPEQIKGREVDFRADIYTLGITLFEAVTGRLPFERKTNYALMHAHVQENPPAPRQYQSEIPRELEKVILKAIAKEPERRFQTMEAFRRALLRDAAPGRWAIRPVRPLLPGAPKEPGRKVGSPHGAQTSRHLRLAGAALAVIVTIAAVGFSYYDHTGPIETTVRAEAVIDKYAPLRKAWGNR